MLEEDKKPHIGELNSLISQYVKLRRYIKKEEASLKDKMRRFVEAKDMISNYLSAVLIQSKLRRVGGSSGTVFNSEIVRYKVVDARAYLNWLIETGLWETAKIEPIPKETDAVASERLEKWLKENEGKVINPYSRGGVKFEHFLPPGVNRTVTTVLVVRASGDDDNEL